MRSDAEGCTSHALLRWSALACLAIAAAFVPGAALAPPARPITGVRGCPHRRWASACLEKHAKELSPRQDPPREPQKEMGTLAATCREDIPAVLLDAVPGRTTAAASKTIRRLARVRTPSQHKPASKAGGRRHRGRAEKNSNSWAEDASCHIVPAAVQAWRSRRWSSRLRMLVYPRSRMTANWPTDLPRTIPAASGAPIVSSF
jgi:hypothetical protein